MAEKKDIYKAGFDKYLEKREISQFFDTDPRYLKRSSGRQDNVAIYGADNQVVDSGYALGLITATASPLIMNGNFNIWNRNTTFTPNDDTYTADRWNALVETNASWTFARSSTAPVGSLFSIRFVNSTANNQCGMAQFLRSQDAYQLMGETISVTFKAVSAVGISRIGCAVLSWSGTADAVTSDVVGTWASDGTNPTWAANWAEEGSDLFTLTSSFTEYKLENIAIDSASPGTIHNIALVFWVDDGTITASDEFAISQVQVNIGELATPFKPRYFSDEQRSCSHYYRKSYSSTVVPGTASQETGFASGLALSTQDILPQNLYFDTEMFRSPTFAFYSYDGSAAKVSPFGTVTTIGSTVSAVRGSVRGILTLRDSGSGFTTGAWYWFHWVADAEM